MGPSQIKGALLEYTVRKILTGCGFSDIKNFDDFVFKKGSSIFVNGKGSAHEADVILEPPIQIPFYYPTRLIFECKAYKNSVGLPIVRNISGMRTDINSIEIVTKEIIQERQRNFRTSLALHDRTRFIYQIGLATTGKLTLPAIEFAANNKIPLLSLSWIFDEELVSNINEINDDTLSYYSNTSVTNLFNYLKNDQLDSTSYNRNVVSDLLSNIESPLSVLINRINEEIKHIYVGVLDTGELLFLKSINVSENLFSYEFSRQHTHKARLYFDTENQTSWELELTEYPDKRFSFYLPRSIISVWAKYGMDRRSAINIKQQFFSNIYLFKKNNLNEIPIIRLQIDQGFLNELLMNL